MTVAPDTPRLEFTDLADAVAALRGRGLRLTTPRRLVLEALFAAAGPLSAEHIADDLTLDLTSVYRNLEAFERHGLARHVHLGHGPGLYALVGRGEHEFLSCERCGAVRTLTPEQLDPIRDQVKERFGYEARFTHFPIVGLCPACASSYLAQPPPHEHQHSHGDYVHSHAHAHMHGAEEQHRHDHPQDALSNPPPAA